MKRLIFTLFACVLVTVSMAAQSGTENINPPFKIHYSGNVEAGNTFSLYESRSDFVVGYATLTTAHGIAVKPWLFTGLGTGMWVMYGNGYFGIDVPLYANVRAYIPGSSLPFYLDYKIGAVGIASNATSAVPVRFYMSPSIGVRYKWHKEHGLTLAVGYDYVPGYHLSGLSVRLGFTF